MVVVLDYGLLPPEINSGRMYAGAGVGPMLAAAAAWDALAVELATMTAAYHGALTELTGGPWLGPAAMSMSAAAAPYVTWLSATTRQAEQAAMQAKSAAAAYEAAFAMTVPPPVIAANRAQLMMLVATNFFGQNTPAIAANEAHYAQMWAQDAAAMYGYAGDSAVATQVTPFTPAPHTTNPAGLAGQAAAQPNSLAAAPVSTPAGLGMFGGGFESVVWGLGSAVALMANASKFVQQGDTGTKALTEAQGITGVGKPAGGTDKPAAGAAKPAGGPAQALGGKPGGLAWAPFLSSNFGGNVVMGSVGKAAHVGGLSVPPGMLKRALVAAAAGAGAIAAEEAMHGLPGLPGLARGQQSQGLRFVPRYGYRHRVMAAPPDARQPVAR